MLCIGKIISTRGLKGELKVYPYTNEPEDLNRIKSVYLDEDINKKLEIEKINFSKGLLFIKFKNIDDIDKAESINNTFIYIDEKEKQNFLGDDSFFYSDIIGSEVYDENNTYLGKVEGVKKLPKQTILVIKNKEHEWLLPNVKEFVKQVDTDKKQIYVKLIEGLYNYED